ncbi:MAG TPA: hypothetical protein VFI65_10520 [Streptosporangiaceae bacterium]|nr:hypothetical protein [Streptosporangiaceae bacterium]
MRTSRQDLPFQCSNSGKMRGASYWAQPTAHASSADVAVTANRSPLMPWLGLGTRRHDLPFHRRIKVAWCRPSGVPVWPTAHASRADTAATPVNVRPVRRRGQRTWRQR